MADLCTLADVKLRLWPDGDTTDTTSDSLLNEFIPQATEDIQGYCGRQFVADTVDVAYYFDMRARTRVLYVPKGIFSVTTLEVAVQTQPPSGGTYTTMAATTYNLRPTAANRTLGPGQPPDELELSDSPSGQTFYAGYNTVRLTGKLGWLSVPVTINAVALAAVIRRYAARQSGQVPFIGGEGFGGPTLRYTSPEEREQLDRYAYLAFA